MADTSERCTGSWGLCYPKPEANVYKFQVPIGGFTQVADISEYIRVAYQAGLAIALTASIVLVMVAGFRWMTAGGNATAIGSAKTMMGNVVIGIVLILGAYLIFQTINPDITTLKLPRVSKIRPQTLNSTAWCDDLFPREGGGDSKIQFAFAGKAPKLTAAEQLGGDKYVDYTKDRMQGRDCNEAFYPVTDPSQECYARKCSNEREICLLQDDKSYKCQLTALAGEIMSSSDREVNNVTLWMICNDGVMLGYLGVAKSVASADVETVFGRQKYIFREFGISSTLPPPVHCALNDGEKGFILAAEVKEPGVAIYDVFALKRQGSTCSILDQSNDVYDLPASTFKNAPQSYFFQRSELTQGGVRCDINVVGAPGL